jgi:magnesium-transporting ATPase (P-type)
MISPLNPAMGYIPLCGMIILSMIKSGWEDWLRHKRDRELNEKQITVRDGSTETSVQWKEINPGDILVVKKDEEFPADCVILSAESGDRKCRIETSALDGETVLKLRDPIACKELPKKCLIKVSKPDPRLSVFSGHLDTEHGAVTLSKANFVPRGCFLRRTNSVTAMAIYTGNSTKIIQNTMKPIFKMTLVDKFLSKACLSIVVFIVVIALVFDLSAFAWTRRHMDDEYLHLAQQNALYYFYNFFSWFLVINPLIPLCIYSSLDLVRFLMSLRMNYQCRVEDGAASICCRNSDLVSQIGRITHIFCDKTGTLTKNRMSFDSVGLACGIFGDESNGETHSERLVTMSRTELERFLGTKDPAVRKFLLSLCLCHAAVVVTCSDHYDVADIQKEFPDFV